jgi:hypothetical protein
MILSEVVGGEQATKWGGWERVCIYTWMVGLVLWCRLDAFVQTDSRTSGWITVSE